MNTGNGSWQRGTVIRVPDTQPGIVMVDDCQVSFRIEGMWISASAPTPNMVVEVLLGDSGEALRVRAIDASVLNQERIGQASRVAQEQGRRALELGKSVWGGVSARMGQPALIAGLCLWVGWFFMPSLSIDLGFASRSLTYWQLLQINNLTSGDVTTGSVGLFGLIGLVSIAAPFARPFISHPLARWINAAPLLFLLATYIRFQWMMRDAIDSAQRQAGSLGPDSSAFATSMINSVLKSMEQAIHLAYGLWIVLAASFVLAGLTLLGQNPPSRAHVRTSR